MNDEYTRMIISVKKDKGIHGMSVLIDQDTVDRIREFERRMSGKGWYWTATPIVYSDRGEKKTVQADLRYCSGSNPTEQYVTITDFVWGKDFGDSHHPKRKKKVIRKNPFDFRKTAYKKYDKKFFNAFTDLFDAHSVPKRVNPNIDQPEDVLLQLTTQIDKLRKVKCDIEHTITDLTDIMLDIHDRIISPHKLNDLVNMLDEIDYQLSMYEAYNK